MTEAIHFAGFWRRAAAFAIDTLIVCIPCFIVEKLAGLNPLGTGNSALFYDVNYGEMVVIILYTAIFLSSRWRATPGMRFLKAYLVRANDYAPVRKPFALLRSVLFYTPMILSFILVTHIQPSVSQDDLPAFSTSDILRYKEIRHRQATGESISIEEDKFVMETDQTLDDAHYKNQQKQARQMAFLGLLALLIPLIMPATIAFTREKKSLCDIICKTRMLYGRT